MSQINGQLSICERCGAQVFRRCTGEGEADGGYTRWNSFENYPEGWGLVNVPKGVSQYNCVRVCPRCHKVWDDAIESHFIRGSLLDVPKEAAEES